MKRLAAIVVSLAIVTALAPSTRTAADTVTIPAGLQGLADRRAAAITTRNKSAFLATIDPAASTEFIAAQSSYFDGITSLPLTNYRLTVTTANSGDLSNGLHLADRYRADRVSLPETRETFRLGTFDSRDAANSFWFSYIVRNGRWYIANDTDAAIIGLSSAQSLWDRGPVNVITSDHFIVVTRTDQAARARNVIATAESAWKVFAGRWPLDVPTKMVIIDPGTPAEAARILAASVNVANFSAFTSYVPMRDGGWQTTAPRVFVQDDNLSRQSATMQRDTLVHEFVHVATADLAGPDTPTWVQEGLAEWIRLDKPSTVNPVVAQPTLPMDGDFAESKTITQAYRSASSAMAYLASIKGQSAPLDLFRAIGARRIDTGSPSYNIDQAFRSSVGMSVADFQTQWQKRFAAPTSANTARSAAT